MTEDCQYPSVAKLGRLQLAIEWVGLVIVGTFGCTTFRVWIYTLTYEPEPDVRFDPWSDLSGMFMLAPLGWLFPGVLGPLWLVLAGLVGALKTRSRVWHWLTAVGCALLGAFWPFVFWGWMGI